MIFFSIRDVQNLTGIKAHTLRIWEQRHCILNPRRKDSNHRLYDNDDLKRLLRVAFLYRQGYKISKIAGLSEDAISQLTLQFIPEKENYEVFINHLIEATIDLDHEKFEGWADTILQQANFEQGVLDVFFPLLRKIGHIWLAGNVMPAQEHFVSAIIIKKILKAIDTLERPVSKSRRRVLLYTPHGERHEIPLLFMQYMLKKNGVPSVYLGSNVKTETLTAVCSQLEKQYPDQPITQVYFHLITNLIRSDLGEYLHQVGDMFPAKEVIYGGSKTGTYIARGIPSNVRLIRGTAELKAFCEGR